MRAVAVLLSTLSAQFPRACGLKFRAPESRAWRGVRLAEGKLFQPVRKYHKPARKYLTIFPQVDTGWAGTVFVCVAPRPGERGGEAEAGARGGRVGEGEAGGGAGAGKRLEKSKCSDLIVLGLPWKTTEQELRTYFEPFGEVLMAQVGTINHH